MWKLWTKLVIREKKVQQQKKTDAVFLSWLTTDDHGNNELANFICSFGEAIIESNAT